VKIRVLFLATLIVGAVLQLSAQEQPDLGAGFKPFGSYDVNDIDSVNLENGNLIVAYQLLHISHSAAADLILTG
jgi:hypothetical protein